MPDLKKCHLTKEAELFFSGSILWPLWPDFSCKEMVALALGQINAGKFSYSSILLGSRQILWYMKGN
jgi:hypothetical protein